MKTRLSQKLSAVVVSVLCAGGFAAAHAQVKAPTLSDASTAARTAASSAAKTAEAKATAAVAKPAAKKPGDLIDINTATKQQLMTLPGIGENLSQKIIEGRPYRAKNQLTQQKIVPEATYGKISELIIAKQATGPSATTKAQTAVKASAAAAAKSAVSSAPAAAAPSKAK